MTASFPIGSRPILSVTLATILTALGFSLGDTTGRLDGSDPAAAQASNPEFAVGNVCIGCHSPADGPLLSGVQLGR
jgi:hypothetical protein